MSELSVTALAEAFREGRLTPVDVFEASLAQIQSLNPRLNAVVAMDEAGARAAAEAAAARWRDGAPLSPIDGVPVGAKANLAIAGLPWTAAIEGYRDRIAEADAFAVAALRRAGAIVLASLNMHEGALGATTTSPLYGPCQNPLRDGYTPGGSSGGSAAAVAAGMLSGALGTDTMGSVRIPAAYTGTCGFKPSFGRVSRVGLELTSNSLDHVGLQALTVEDLALLFSAIDVFDPRDPYAARVAIDAPLPAQIKVGRLACEGVAISPLIASAFASALARMESRGWRIANATLDGYDFSAMRRKGLLVTEAEGAALLAPLRSAHPDAVSKDFAAMLDYGARQSAEKLAAAQYALAKTRTIARSAFADFDVLVCPTAPQTAFPHDQSAPHNQADLTAFANFAGLPAVAVPIGAADDGLPASLQIIAPYGCDALALAVARAVERAC
ncbi:MAG: amidase [Caulobacterales bacterium]